jgi:pimeloyl-ACP methyl ester carboxylesterase
VIHGSEDLIVPVENGRRLAERLPNAEYLELPGRGHNLPLEEPGTFADAVRGFLERVR